MDLLLPSSQYGFRSGRSCDHCLAEINLEIYRSFARKQITGALFLDIEGAYDSVDIYILFDILNQMNIPSGYKRFFCNFLSPRIVNFYESGALYSQRCIGRGLPQGSVLSPLLFNLYVKDVLNYIPHTCRTIQFADDFTIMSSGWNPDSILKELSEAFYSVSCWL